MNRVLWFMAGAGAGVYGLTKARRAAEALTPEGLADRLAGLSVGLHLFREEVRAGMDEKETELRDRLAVALTGGSTARREIEAPGLDRLDSTDQPMREGND